MTNLSTCNVWLFRPCYIHFSNKYRTSYCHGDGNDRQVNSREVEALYADMFPAKDVSPQQSCQRRTESRTEGTVVDPERHRIHGRPESALSNRLAADIMNEYPCLYDTRQ